MIITCRTRFDITASGVRSNFNKNRMAAADEKQWTHDRNQQRNWETINQIISLRTLPVNITLPQRIQVDGKTFWEFVFEVEQPATIEYDGDPVGILKADCRDVPMIVGLDEDSGIQGVLIVDTNIEFAVDPNK